MSTWKTSLTFLKEHSDAANNAYDDDRIIDMLDQLSMMSRELAYFTYEVLNQLNKEGSEEWLKRR